MEIGKICINCEKHVTRKLANSLKYYTMNYKTSKNNIHTIFNKKKV